MGSAKVPLSRVEVAGGAEVWAELSRERRPPEELQELLLSLSYLPSAERLTVVVLKARNLLPPQEGKDALGKSESSIICKYISRPEAFWTGESVSNTVVELPAAQLPGAFSAFYSSTYLPDRILSIPTSYRYLQKTAIVINT